MSLILTVTLSVTSMNTVAEASPKMSPTEENLEITINSFLESDGAVAEELTDEMLKTFLETPLDFLRVIDTYPLDKQELLLSRIANVAVGMPDEERLSFEDIIYSADETTPGISLLETYYSEALEATPPQNSVSNLPKYDMESVNQIVKAYLASDSEGNEAFYNYLSNVYSAEPELMESVMMNYAVQNAFVQIIRHFDKIHKIPREELPFWIISIVKNEALSIIRKRQKTVSLENWDGYIIESENVLDYADDSIEFFIHGFRLGGFCRAWCSLRCLGFLLFFLHWFNNILSHIIIDVCHGFQLLLTGNRQYRPDRAKR